MRALPKLLSRKDKKRLKGLLADMPAAQKAIGW